MRRLVPALPAACLVLVISAGAALAATNTMFSVNLKGENQPGGDLDATGQAHLELLPGTDMVCYTLKWSKIDENVTGAHIHEAEFGGIVITLFGGPILAPTDYPGDKFTTRACATGDSATIDAIIANPSNYYVNVHTDPVLFHGVLLGFLK